MSTSKANTKVRIGLYTSEAGENAKTYASKFSKSVGQRLAEELNVPEDTLVKALHDEMYWAYYFGFFYGCLKVLKEKA